MSSNASPSRHSPKRITQLIRTSLTEQSATTTKTSATAISTNTTNTTNRRWSNQEKLRSITSDRNGVHKNSTRRNTRTTTAIMKNAAETKKFRTVVRPPVNTTTKMTSTNLPKFDGIERKIRYHIYLDRGLPFTTTDSNKIFPTTNNNNIGDKVQLVVSSGRGRNNNNPSDDPVFFVLRHYMMEEEPYVVKEVVNETTVNEKMKRSEREERSRTDLRNAFRKVVFLATLTFLLSIAIFVPLGTLVFHKKGGTRAPIATPTGTPSTSPSLPPISERFETLVQRLSKISDPAKFRIPTSPQFKALSWLAYEDISTDVDAPNLVQRYVAAVFYHSTNGEDWILCSKGSGCKCNESDGIYASCGAIQDSKAWLSEENECEWYRLRCDDNGAVNSIRFENHSNGLVGTVPDELRFLTEINFLGLANNSNAVSNAAKNVNRLTGTIPEFLGTSFRDLSTLVLSYNRFSGTLPKSLWSLTSLRELRLDSNRLVGTVSDGIESLTNLRVANFSHNAFSGSLPEGVGSLDGLDRLCLRSNDFNGTVPESVCSRVENSALTLSIDCDVECECCEQCYS